MSLQTITLARPYVLPQSTDCECCAGHLLEALRARVGVATAHLDGAHVVLQVDARLVPAEAERLACEAGQQIAQRYDHPVFNVEGMDCADCARTFEHALGRLSGVHYAVVNFAAARLRLEYDREETSVAAIEALARSLGYRLAAPQAASSFACTVEGMCCAVEAGALERALRTLPGVQHVVADPALARLAVRYDPQMLGAAQIHSQVEQLGFRIATGATALPTSAAPQAAPSLAARVRERPKEALMLLCAALIGLAWLAEWLGLAPATSTALYVLATLSGGIFVARAGWATLRTTRSLDMNMLMSIAALGALLIGEYAEGAAVVFLFALGNALEGYTMERARRSIRALMQLAPATALVLRPNTNASSRQSAAGSSAEGCRLPTADCDPTAVPIEQVAVGETIVVRPGDRVPLDALVLAGSSALNQAPITGESVPVAKSPGDELFAGSINGDGALEARVTRRAQDSTLARIIHMVEAAQAQKSRAQRFVDVFARYYTPAVLALAVLVALLPPLLLGGLWGLWFYRALVLLVIACPCALVISTPVSIVSAISAAARAGVLFKGGAALEAAGSLRAVAFDKTGTLTEGRPVVTEVIENADLRVESRSSILHSQFSILTLAAAVERRSAHPLAHAIIAAAEQRGLPIPPASGFRAHNGQGASAMVDGRLVQVGNRALFAGQALPPALEQQLHALEQAGRTVMLVSSGGELLGLIAAADTLRPAAPAALAALRQVGIAHIAMLTGDAAPVAAQIGAQAGVDEVYAGLLPEQKLAMIGELIARHGSVAMVGDGVNDTPALARATVGVAMGAAGSDAALETADVALMADDLGKLPFAIGLSRATRRIIAQNIAFALAVKLVFLAATVLGAATLWMAVFADSGAALIVIANGMRLLRKAPQR